MVLHQLCSHLQNASKARMKFIRVPFSKTSSSILEILYENGMIQSFAFHDNKSVAKRELSVELKYRHGSQVLNKLQMISKPSRRVFTTSDELLKVVIMNQYKTAVGDLIIIKTPDGIMESRDALKHNLGGEVLLVAK